MTIYDILVSDELLPELTNDNPLMPPGFRIIGPADGPAPPHAKRLRVEDDHAPDWTQGRLVSPVFTSHYRADDHVTVVGTTVTDSITYSVSAHLLR